MKGRALLIFIIIFIVIGNVGWAISEVSFSTLTPYQGDTVLVSFPVGIKPASVTFDNALVPFFETSKGYRAVFGISATKTPNTYIFSYVFQNGSHGQESIVVRAKKWPKFILPVPKQLNIKEEELPSKLSDQNAIVRKNFEISNPTPFFTNAFGLPLYDNRKITSVFGEIRKTGKSEIRHLGVDFGGRLGAPVAAMNIGRVIRAYSDPIYGNSVIIDHGAQIFSSYLHLNEIRAKEGAMVKQGEVIGTLGKTGYATERHLHLSVRVLGIPVDPLRFVFAFSKL